MAQAWQEPQSIPPRIGLWDAVSMILGIIIGVGIFETPPRVFQAVESSGLTLLVWALGGLLALVGALCFAELASTYPHSGGEYIYLTRAYGRGVGFLFAWSQLTVIRPASIAAVAYVFGHYVVDLQGGDDPRTIVLLAVLSILLLSTINILGVHLSKWVQNTLTVTKVGGLAALTLAGFFWARPEPAGGVVAMEKPAGFAWAMILVLWTYAGWHEAAYIATEVKKAPRNIPRALLLGTLVTTLLYLLVNAAFLVSLDRGEVQFSDRFQPSGSGSPDEITVLDLFPGRWARLILGLLIWVSALGAVNGMIFTTARIYAAFAQDHILFAPLSRWSRRWGTPVRALLVQAGLSIAFALVIGLGWGQRKAFEALVNSTAAVFWIFFLLTGISLFLLRKKDPELIRPFRVPLYPFLPVVFCLWCGYLVVGSLQSGWESLIGVGLVFTGLPFFWLSRKAL